MYLMKSKEWKHCVTRGIARTMIMSLLFGVIGGHTEVWTIEAQAKENADYNTLDGGGVVSLGTWHSAVIKADGSLWTWGWNNCGQLGNGTTEDSSKPIEVLKGVKAVSLGSYDSAAIKIDGSLWMWGNSNFEQFGTAVRSNEPVEVMKDVKAVSMGYDYRGVIKKDGSLWMWGRNEYGQLGNGTTKDSSEPIEVMKDVKAVSLSGSHSAVIKTDDSLWMWGNNIYGQLGNGTTEDSCEPIEVMKDVKAVSLGSVHSAAIKTDGSLWTWGANTTWQLGNSTSTQQNSTFPVKIMNDAEVVSLGGSHSAAIKKDGSLWMWGNNIKGQQGDGCVYMGGNGYPHKLMDNVKAVSLGDECSSAVKVDGSLWMWGDNSKGQLGNGTTQRSTVPVQIMPAGSVLMPGTSPSAPSKLPINTEVITEPQIKVIDFQGSPVSNATVSYNQKTFTTSEKGTVTLDNYQTGKQLVISKTNYATKTVPSFVKGKTGITTYILAGANSPDSIYLIKDDEKINLLTEEAQINTYHSNSVQPELEMIYASAEKYDNYTLYSGEKMIGKSDTGVFPDLKPGVFSVDEPVYLSVGYLNRPVQKKKLNIHVVNISPPVDAFYLGNDGLKITIPENIPVVGGETFTVELDDLPAECNFKSDGTVQIGINADMLMKNKGLKFHELFPRLKNLDAGNVSSFLGTDYRQYSKSGLTPDFTIIGYLESNVNDWSYLQGKLFVELSMEFANENQLSVGPVPVVVEISIEGKVNADGSIRWSAAEGMTGTIGVGGGVELGVYGGVGIAKLISGGIYGSGEFGLHYVILPEDSRGLDEAYIGGELGLEGKVLGKAYKCSIISGKWYIIGDDAITPMSAVQGDLAAYSIDNYDVYNCLGREYLSADGSMQKWLSDNQSYANGSTDETVLQNAANLDAVPQVIRMGDTVMLFYLTDAGTVRSAADRSMLVYSLWDEAKAQWGEPKAVLDDGTADYNPDFYTDGEKIYAVWQDARENLADDLSLEETVKQMTLHAAVYDAEQRQFVDLGTILSENELFQQSPQIVADDSGVSVYWYENAQDNVLGLSGTNRIYQASLTDETVLREGIQVMNVSEEEAEDVEEETPDKEEPAQDEPDGESSDAGESVSGNSTSAFRKFVALTEETPVKETLTEEESVSGNTTPEDGEGDSDENDTPSVNPGGDKGENEGEDKGSAEEESSGEEDAAPDKPEESVSGNTVPEESVSENTVSENTISENTVQVNTYNVAGKADQPWAVAFLREETDCIFSADAGRMNGKTGYAFVAGTMDQFYNVEESKVFFMEQGQAQAKVLKSGTAEKTEFSPVYAEETLTWYESGDIHYIDENGSTAALFGEGRIPSWSYTLLSDGTSPEVFFPVNVGGRANLYRISRENGAFLPVLQVTDQEDYIQYADGFVKDGQTILVYNKMKVNDKLEEESNSLCTGVIAHSYYDIAVQSAGSMILYNEETGGNELEISAKLYNNGTVKAENLRLSLCAPDGTALETVPVDAVLEPGEEKSVSAVFSPDKITQEAAYTLTLSGAEESNQKNNSVKLKLGKASLQVESKVISVADTRTIQAGIQNTGVTPCGGTVSVRDTVTGEAYCSGTFEPIERGKTAVVEVELAPSDFQGKADLALEVVVLPDKEGVETVRDFVTAYIPSYEVSFVTDAEVSTVYADYGTQVSFPENPAKEGKHFIGWYDAENPADGTLYTEEMPVTKELILYACFADEERAQIPLSECSVSPIPMQFYTGKALKPKVTVKWGSEVLKANKDYKVTYQDNKEQGTAKAVITAVTGNGKKYTGSIERTFSIMYPTSKVSVKTIPAVTFTGEAHTPEPVVTYQKKTLVKDRDYTVSYFNNRNAGTAGVTIKGKGTFSGEKTVTFQIKGTTISGMKFEKIPDVTYNGKNTKPIVTVRTKDGKTQLMSGSDYRLVYENTVNKGTATVTVIGNGNYTGTKKLTYKVVAKPLTESMVAVEQPAAASVALAEQAAPTALVVAPEKAEYTYTGKDIKPALTVTDEQAGEAPLVLNRDYTVSYSKNKAVGEAQITVKGKGNYSGTLKVPFTISPVDLAQAKTAGTLDIRVNDIAYTGRALEPAVQVYETVDGKERKLSGSAYTLSYSNNTEKGSGTVTVTGKEKAGYKGTVTADFRIVDKAKLLTASAIKIDAITAQTYTGSALEPVLRIVDKSDKNQEITLQKGTHYEVTYRNNVNAGKATVTVKGIGSYAGSKNITFKINKCAIADKNGLCAGFAVENLADMKYTGYALKPDVVIKDKGVTMVQGKDYRLSYGKNTNIGTAAVTVTGIGNYSGSYKGASFQIRAWDYNTLTAEIADQTYTGKALKPQVAFYMTGENGREEIVLKPNTAVKLAYRDNKDAGTATVTVSGKGELKNIAPFTVSFAIDRADVNGAVVSRIPNQTLKGTAVKPIPKVKVGRNSLKANRDFTVSYIRNGVRGEATVIIRGVGNYTGECRKTFIVQ